MKIMLNNKEEILDSPKSELTITGIRNMKRFTFSHLVVKINGRLIKKNEYDSAVVKDGDKVDIIHLISGG